MTTAVCYHQKDVLTGRKNLNITLLTCIQNCVASKSEMISFIVWSFPLLFILNSLFPFVCLFPIWCPVLQLSEVEVNGQIEQVCEQVYSEMQSQAMEAAMDSLDTMDTLPMPGCFRMRSHSYVRAIDQGCAGEEEGEGGRPLLLLPSSPPRTSATTVRTIQSSTGRGWMPN